MTYCSRLSIIFLYAFIMPRIVSATDNWFKNGPVEYLLSSNVGSVAFAESQCQLMNGKLATLSDGPKFLFVRNNIPKKNKTMEHLQSRRFYVNARRRGTGNKFFWSDNKTFPSSEPRWGSYQPSDLPSENCIAMDEKWVYNVNCSDTFYNYVCQRIIGSFWRNWENWSACSSSCITGITKRIRRCNKLEDKGVHYCNSTDTETKACRTHLCNKIMEISTLCNASCGEVSFFNKSQVCKYNTTLNDQCKNVTIHKCTGTCPTTSAFTTTVETREIVSTTTDEMPFIKANFGIIIGVSVAGLIILIFIVFVVLIVKRNNKSNMKPNETLDFHDSHTYSNSRASFSPRTNTANENKYEAAKYTSSQQVYFGSSSLPESDNLAAINEHNISDNDYVTIANVASTAIVASAETQAEGKFQQEAAVEIPETSSTHEADRITTEIENDDYVCLDTSQFTIHEEKDNVGSYVSVETVIKTSETCKSAHTSKPKPPQPSTLEFDYVTVDNIKEKDVGEYGKLNVPSSPVKPYSQTYDSLTF